MNVTSQRSNRPTSPRSSEETCPQATLQLEGEAWCRGKRFDTARRSKLPPKDAVPSVAMSQSLRTVNVSLVESLSPRSKAHTRSYQDSPWSLPYGFCSSYPVLMLYHLEKLPNCGSQRLHSRAPARASRAQACIPPPPASPSRSACPAVYLQLSARSVSPQATLKPLFRGTRRVA